MDEVLSDRYGPLNIYNPNRNSSHNPGGMFSSYDRDGNLRNDDEEDEEREEELNAYDAQMAAPLPAIGAPAIGRTGPRRSTRLAGIEVFIPDINCSGEDPISHLPIDPVIAINLEADGRCYNINTIADAYRRNSNETPFRNTYSDTDKQRIEAYLSNVARGKIKRNKKTKKKNKKSKRKSVKRKRSKRRQ